jgi:hypothetical protein
MDQPQLRFTIMISYLERVAWAQERLGPNRRNTPYAYVIRQTGGVSGDELNIKYGSIPISAIRGGVVRRRLLRKAGESSNT